jgi:flagellar biosynthesis protein
MSGITGPTARPRFAVAVLYEDAHTPKVVASGQGWVGEKFIETAREHGVPIEEDPVLAQALSTIEVDEEIPEALYRAVAEVLSFLLKR